MPSGAIRAQIQADGTVVVYMPGDELPPAPPPSLADAKSAKITEINVDCQSRILAVWPLGKQISALAGVYGQSEAEAMTSWVDGHIAASNAASDAVDAETTLEAVEAVAVAWPV
jgi:hypothetical protein